MKTTFSRSLTTVAIVLLVGLLLVGVSLQVLVKDFLTDQTVEGLKKDAKVIAELVQAYTEDLPFSNRDFSIALTVAASVSGADAVICNAKGSVVLCSDSPTGCSHQGMYVNQNYLNTVVANGGAVNTGVISNLYEDTRYVVARPINDLNTGKNMGIVIVSSPVSSTLNILGRITDIFLFVALLVVVVAVLLITAFAQRLSRPLLDMSKAAYKFGHGDFTARVQTDGSSTQEMEELALSFNNMASSLQKSEYQRQEFVANVSHELKTPMTTISGYVDGILDGTIPETRRNHYLQIVSDETKRLSRLVRSMLDISQLQNQDIPEEKKMHFDLEEAVGQVLITFEKKINDKNLNVDVEFPEHPVYTIANRDYITQVVYNLLDNAVKFCPEGGTLGLKIRESDSKAYISISNTGDTIPPEELPLVFDRFHKLDKSRSKNRDGWGLGLYIVKTIVCSHGENISVTSREGKTEFTFTMPLVN
jgi:signal transduction histidine kinase